MVASKRSAGQLDNDFGAISNDEIGDAITRLQSMQTQLGEQIHAQSNAAAAMSRVK